MLINFRVKLQHKPTATAVIIVAIGIIAAFNRHRVESGKRNAVERSGYWVHETSDASLCSIWKRDNANGVAC